MLEREHLVQLMWEGMKAVLEKGGFSENSLMKQLAEKEIEDHMFLIEEESVVGMQLESVDIATNGAGGNTIEANFVTDEGEYVSIQVTQWIHTYLSWTEMAGGVSVEDIERDVEIALEGRDIDKDSFDMIKEEVKRLLKERGVVIIEP
jgi:hypothetical protein